MMQLPSLALIVFSVFFLKLPQTTGQPTFACHTCTPGSNYTSGSTYRKNLMTVLTTMSTNVGYGFYNLSVGQNSDKVYGVARCRGDISLADCNICLTDATKRLPKDCPLQKEAIGYYPECLVRYSDRSILGIMESSPMCTIRNTEKIPDPDIKEFNQTLATLLDTLRNRTAAMDSRFKFATDQANVTGSLSIYAQTQCNPDLSQSNCSICLQGGIRELHLCCNNEIRAIIYNPSCGVSFGDSPFTSLLGGASQPAMQPFAHPPSNNESKPEESGKHKTGIIVAVSCLLFLLLAAFMFYVSQRRRRRRRKTQGESQSTDQIRWADAFQFDFGTIQVATDNFSDARRVGKSSSTAIHKGMLPGGQEVAVKNLSRRGTDGEREFNNEVLLLTNLQHRNLVKFLGCCITEDLRLMMYEYQPNESLDQFLHDPAKRAHLDWETRCKIILGIARGLLYLHEDSQLRVIHRDLKASNILLSADMVPKISNFRKASLINADQTKGETNTIKGTYGYMAPEYVLQGHFSVRSDVFSFGVILLEIINGQLISSISDGQSKESLLSYAWRKWSENTALDVVDQTMPSSKNHTTQILRYIQIALLCVQEEPASRPTMSTVVFMLNSGIVDVPDPSRPGFIIHSDMDQFSVQSSNVTNVSYHGSVDEASFSNLEPR